jgi:hypothetical protein
LIMWRDRRRTQRAAARRRDDRFVSAFAQALSEGRLR